MTIVGRGCGCLLDGESPNRKLLVKFIPATGHYVVQVNLNMANLQFLVFYKAM